jgi:hypothetical protein
VNLKAEMEHIDIERGFLCLPLSDHKKEERKPRVSIITVVSEAVSLAYGCLDRIVLRGYYPALQREENIVHFFREVVGVRTVDGGALGSRTLAYRKWLDGYVREHGIERLPAPKGKRKEEVVERYYQALGDQEGIACILTSMELGTTFISYEPRSTTADQNYRRISGCRKRFQHLYFYLFDHVLGQMRLQIATYLPFTIQIYLNGHSFVARQLTLQGVRFRKHDNALLATDNVRALRVAAASLTPELIQGRCDYWASQFAPQFSPSERRRAGLPGYAYSMAQVEYSYDTVFRTRMPLQEAVRRMAERGALLGGADRTMAVFGRRIDRRYRGRLMTVLEARNQGHPTLRSYFHSSFAKLYTKPDEHHRDRCLRIEVCVNDPRHFGVKRSLEHLPALVDRMTTSAERYLDLHADLLDSTFDAGDLAQLSLPTQRGSRRIPGIRLHDDRVLRLLDVLQQPASLIGDWTVSELHARMLERHRLAPDTYRISQLRYDLWKLRAKGIVERVGSTRRYRVTPSGTRLAVLLVKLRFRLLGPLVTIATHPCRHPIRTNDSVEVAIRSIDTALNDLCSAIGLKAA